jgi:hypothetical protein
MKELLYQNLKPQKKLHFISSDDVYWMLNLSASKIKASLKSRHIELGLTDSIITTTTGIIEKT